MESHSFSEEFYVPEGCDPYDPNTFVTESGEYGRPTSLIEAIWLLRNSDAIGEMSDYQAACQMAGIDSASELSHVELMTYARQTVDAIDDSRTPVGVYLTADHDLMVRVY